VARPIFIHDFGEFVPTWPSKWATWSGDYDAALMGRIAEAFRFAMRRSASQTADLWTLLVGRHSEFIGLLRDGRLKEADDYLVDMCSTPLTHGFQQGDVTADALRTSEGSRRHVRTNDVDKLMALAAALRVIPVQNPEQGDASPWLRMPPDAILDLIEDKAGVRIAAPAFQGGLWALETRRGLLSARDFMAFYVARRIHDLVADRDARICEIGGGLGNLMFYLRTAGYRRLFLVDLPTIAALQAYFLAKNLGADALALAGEQATSAVTLACPADFPQGRYDLVVNVDSFPEMATAVAEDYLRKIRDSAHLFLSINQEALSARTGREGDVQERVGDMAQRVGGFRLVSRAPYWMRLGYVEEVYEVIHSTGQ
jgi:hypothetical protein